MGEICQCKNAPLQTLPVPLRDTYDIQWSLDTR